MATYRKVKGEKASLLMPGKMYFYKYEAFDTEYYNKFPLIFLLRKRGDSFEGIDFHYLFPLQRILLYNRMKSFFSTPEITEDTILQTVGFRKIIHKSKRFKAASIIFKKYKRKNIRSKIIEINPNDWLSMIKRPVEKFIVRLEEKKLISRLVWKKSLKLQRKR